VRHQLAIDAGEDLASAASKPLVGDLAAGAWPLSRPCAQKALDVFETFVGIRFDRIELVARRRKLQLTQCRYPKKVVYGVLSYQLDQAPHYPDEPLENVDERRSS
jgi:hypothetical protein